MKFITIKELYKNTAKYADQTITIGAWIRSIRSSSAFGFIVLNDGSFFNTLQVVFEADKINNYTEISKLSIGSAIIVKGKLELTPGAKQPFEIKSETIDIEGTSTSVFSRKRICLRSYTYYYC